MSRTSEGYESSELGEYENGERSGERDNNGINNKQPGAVAKVSAQNVTAIVLAGGAGESNPMTRKESDFGVERGWIVPINRFPSRGVPESRVWQSFRFDAIQLEIIEQPRDDDFFEKFRHGPIDNGGLRVTNVSDADEETSGRKEARRL